MKPVPELIRQSPIDLGVSRIDTGGDHLHPVHFPGLFHHFLGGDRGCPSGTLFDLSLQLLDSLLGGFHALDQLLGRGLEDLGRFLDLPVYFPDVAECTDPRQRDDPPNS